MEKPTFMGTYSYLKEWKIDQIKETLRLNYGLVSEDILCPFRRAISEGNISYVTNFLSENSEIDLNAVDFLGCTYVHTSIVFFRWEVLKYFLTLDEVRLNIKNKLGDIPLMTALRVSAPYSIINLLLQQGSDINTLTYKNVTCLHLAAKRQSGEVADLLIRKGADINAIDDDGCTPLHFASFYYETASVLLYYGASANEQSYTLQNTPFMAALSERNEKMAQLFINYVDDFNLIDNSGRTALDLAIFRKLKIAFDIVDKNPDDYYLLNNLAQFLQVKNKYHKEFFLKVWYRLGPPRGCPTLTSSLLWHFLTNRVFQKQETLNNLERIFDSDKFSFVPNKPVRALYKRIYKFTKGMSADTRIKWTYIFLSYDVPVTSTDVTYLYEKIGPFCKEMVAILQSEIYIIPHTIGDLCSKIIDNDDSPVRFNKELNRYYVTDYSWISATKHIESYKNECDSVPFRSLVQISRDSYRKYLYETHNTNAKYGVYNAILKLNLPPIIEDILLLKQPIYD